MTLDLIVRWFFINLSPITVGMCLICTLLAFIIKPPANRVRDLEYVIGKALAGSSVPTGLALLCCAFKAELLSKLDGAAINITLAGIVLIYTSIKSLFTQ